MLPLTGGKLDGQELYRKLVPRFTTISISPEEVYEEGEKQLKVFYKEVSAEGKITSTFSVRDFSFSKGISYEIYDFL